MKVGVPPLTIKVQEEDLTPSGTIRGTTIDYQVWAWHKLKDPCVYCGEPANTKEHILPVSKGGTGGWFNIAKACLECNGKRKSTPLLLFLVNNLHL